MKIRNFVKLAPLALILAFFCYGVANAQTYNAYSGGYNTGYGTVYGSFGQAMATQNLYNSLQNIMQRTMARNLMIKKWGLAAVEKAEREAKSGVKTSSSTVSSDSKIVVSPPPVVRNHGVFRPDATVDTGKAMADALGDTPEQKALIKQVCTATITLYEKEAAAKGWKNNIAGGFTFFTIVAMTVYHDAEEPSADAANNYFKAVNTALDETPEFATVSNKDKQGFNNMLVGFGGMLLAGYTEGKQNNDAATLESYKKLAGMLIQMVLKTDPEKLQLENGQIVIK